MNSATVSAQKLIWREYLQMHFMGVMEQMDCSDGDHTPVMDLFFSADIKPSTNTGNTLLLFNSLCPGFFIKKVMS